MPSLLLIDTNLLLVLLIATVDPEQVPRFKRTRKYSLTDAALLNDYAGEYEGILVTPHVLTEVSNLAGQLSEPLLGVIRDQLSALVPQWIEHAEPAADVVGDVLFRRFGLTDAAIGRAAGKAVAVLTDDLPLYASLSRAGVNAVNFNHLRDAAWKAEQ